METKTLLLLSIARYLQSSGFSKTLKKFRSEAQLEELSFKGFDIGFGRNMSPLLENSGHHGAHNFIVRISGHTATKNGLEKGGPHMMSEGDSCPLLEVLDKKKKKRSGKSNVDAANHHTEEMKNGAVDENVQGKEKKKGKKNCDFPDNDSKLASLKELEESAADATCRLQSHEITVKGQDKRSKKRKLVSVSLVPQDLASFEGNDLVSSKDVKKSENKEEKSKHKSDDGVKRTAKDKQDFKTKTENASGASSKDSDAKTLDEGIKVKKGSKKRKRLESEENDCKPVDQERLDEPKQRKGGDLKIDKVDRQLAKSNAAGISEGTNNLQNGQCNFTEKTPIKRFYDPDNVKRNDGEESAKRDNMKKQCNGSAEEKFDEFLVESAGSGGNGSGDGEQGADETTQPSQAEHTKMWLEASSVVKKTGKIYGLMSVARDCAKSVGVSTSGSSNFRFDRREQVSKLQDELAQAHEDIRSLEKNLAALTKAHEDIRSLEKNLAAVMHHLNMQSQAQTGRPFPLQVDDQPPPVPVSDDPPSGAEDKDLDGTQHDDLDF